MRARVCRLYGQKDLRVEMLDVSPPGPGQVLVALGAGGICGSDLHYWQDGGFGPIRVREPIILGHEASGTVEALGDGVNSLKVGDRVSLNPSHPCGACRFCAEGHPQHCLTMRFMGSALRFPHEQGMFRDHLVVGSEQCHRVGAQTPLGIAALAEPLAVCLRAVRRAQEQGGDLAGRRVVVTGAGPIGTLCAALAQHHGAAEVGVTDVQDATLAVVKRIGATDTVNVSRNPGAMQPWLADKGSFDLAFECSAAPSAIAMAISAVRPLGTIVQVGVAGEVSVPLNLIVSKELQLVGTHRFHGEFAEAVALIESGVLNLSPMITHSLPVAAAAEALALASDRGRSVKVQLVFGEG